MKEKLKGEKGRNEEMNEQINERENKCVVPECVSL